MSGRKATVTFFGPVQDKQPNIVLNELAQLIIIRGVDDLSKNRAHPPEVRELAATLAALVSKSSDVLLTRDPKYGTWFDAPKKKRRRRGK